MYETVAILALAVFLYSAFARQLESSRIGGAITFTVVGLLLGNSVLGLLDLELDGDAIGTLAELTLAFLLFADAAGADLKELARQRILPRRMLLLGLPGAVLLGLAVGIPLFGTSLDIFEIALLAAILAPTDAALGKAVVTDETVPNRIRTKLNFESGLNDGLCVPIFLTFLAFATQQAGDQGFGELVLHLLLEEVGIGAGVGILLSGLACLIIRQAERCGTIGEHWRPLMVPALALACFCSAQQLGGSGFIAAFVGGLVFGGVMAEHAEAFVRPAESIGDGAALLTWVMFGATVAALVIENLTWHTVVYAALSLTVVRMLPVWFSLLGTGTPLREALFLGWFGPRGLASIVFAIMAVEAGIPGAETIALVVACTVAMSIIAHGLSAKPLAARLAAAESRAAQDGPA